MRKNNPNPKVDWYFAKVDKWKECKTQLREISLGSGLIEDLKWGKPCYFFGQDKILLIHGFKEYYAILFFKGALLKDPKAILVRQTENVQATRQIRFTTLQEIIELERTIKDYIQEAIEIEKAGLKVVMKKTSEFNMPEEFKNKLIESPELSLAFEALTPGRQRGYLLYFSGAKQSKTRHERVAKYIPKILNRKGLED